MLGSQDRKDLKKELKKDMLPVIEEKGAQNRPPLVSPELLKYSTIPSRLNSQKSKAPVKAVSSKEKHHQTHQ